MRRELQSSSAALLSALDELRPGTNVRLDTAIREAIGALSTDASADIRIDSKPDPIVIRPDRDEFDVLTRGCVDAAVELTRDMLAVADHMKTSSAHTIIIIILTGYYLDRRRRPEPDNPYTSSLISVIRQQLSPGAPPTTAHRPLLPRR